jgi:hypothetical protein
LLGYFKEKSYNDICLELMDGSVQKTLLPKLKKVYPLSFCDLRVFETKEIEKINLEDALKTGVPIVEGFGEGDVQAISEEAVEEEKEEVVEETVEEETKEKEVTGETEAPSVPLEGKEKEAEDKE